MAEQLVDPLCLPCQVQRAEQGLQAGGLGVLGGRGPLGHGVDMESAYLSDK